MRPHLRPPSHTRLVGLIERLIAVAARVALLLVVGAVSPAAAQPLAVSWTAGGLDAGSTGAGQAARMTVDGAGNVAVVSGPAGGRLLSVRSYTPTGTLRWQQTLAPASGTFVGDWIVAAPNGDVVVLGHALNAQGSAMSPTLARFTTAGTLLWRVDRSILLFGVARLLVDSSGDAYVAVNSDVTKYNAAGAQLWTRTLPAGLGQSMALGPDESDLVAVSAAGARWTTTLYESSTGALRWSVTAPEGVAAKDVVVDAARVYVTGQGSVGTSGFLTVIAYDRLTGARVWRTDASPSGSQATGTRIALAPDGDVVATGYISSGGYLDWWTVALNPSGLVLWQARRDAALTGDETPSAILVLPGGTTVVAGTGGPVVRDALGNSFMRGVVAGYGQDGSLLWEGFASLGAKWAAALPSGDVCATGGYDALVTCWHVGAPAPPDAPSALTATAAPGAVVLTWQDNATNETSYSVERAEMTASGWSPFAVLAGSLPSGTTRFADVAYVAGRASRYRVRASNDAGASAYSNVAEIALLSGGLPPTAAMSVTPATGAAPLPVLVDGSGSVANEGSILSWTWSFGDGGTGSGVTASHVYTAPGTYVVTLTVMNSSHLTASTTRAVVVNTAAPVPTAPTNLSASVLSRSSIRLRWRNGTTTQSEVVIERCAGVACASFAVVGRVSGTSTVFTDSGLASRTTYRYRVSARNASGASPASNVVEARTR